MYTFLYNNKIINYKIYVSFKRKNQIQEKIKSSRGIYMIYYKFKYNKKFILSYHYYCEY